LHQMSTASFEFLHLNLEKFKRAYISARQLRACDMHI